MDITNNIKRFRELKNLSRNYIAAELDMSVSGYSKIERGEVDLTISRIQEIAKILEVDMVLLFKFNTAAIFNLSGDSKLTQEVTSANPNYYMQKYITMLEAEIERLRAL